MPNDNLYFRTTFSFLLLSGFHSLFLKSPRHLEEPGAMQRHKTSVDPGVTETFLASRSCIVPEEVNALAEYSESGKTDLIYHLAHAGEQVP